MVPILLPVVETGIATAMHQPPHLKADAPAETEVPWTEMATNQKEAHHLLPIGLAVAGIIKEETVIPLSAAPRLHPLIAPAVAGTTRAGTAIRHSAVPHLLLLIAPAAAGTTVEATTAPAEPMMAVAADPKEVHPAAVGTVAEAMMPLPARHQLRARTLIPVATGVAPEATPVVVADPQGAAAEAEADAALPVVVVPAEVVK